MLKQGFFVIALSIAAIGSIHAQGLSAVSPLPGYSCMRLNVAPGLLYNHPELDVPVFAAPSSSAPVIGRAAEVMIVRSPQQPTDGYLQVLRPDKSTGWVWAKVLKPWTNPYAPSRRCEPAVMSDGLIGSRTVK